MTNLVVLVSGLTFFKVWAAGGMFRLGLISQPSSQVACPTPCLVPFTTLACSMGAQQSCLPLRWNLPKHEQHHLHQVQQSPHGPPQLLQRLPRRPNVQFRVLIIGRANAGKTSILQRVCDTTESPEIYRVDPSGTRELVCLVPDRVFLLSSSCQVQLDPTIEVGHACSC
jgi:hypothetical protein